MKAADFQGKNTPKRRRSAMSLYGKGAHNRVAKTIDYVLNQGTEAAWIGLIIALMARRTNVERAALAFATLQSLDDQGRLNELRDRNVSGTRPCYTLASSWSCRSLISVCSYNPAITLDSHDESLEAICATKPFRANDLCGPLVVFGVNEERKQYGRAKRSRRRSKTIQVEPVGL